MAIGIKKSLHRSPLRLSLLAVLSAAAVSLELLRIEFPFPLAPFLKYDLVGVPLLLLALLSGRRDALLGASITAIAIFLATGDPVGASMKWLAEVATFIPFASIYGYGGKIRTAAASAVAVASRVAVMDVANIAVTPYWLMIFAHACSTYAQCLTSVEVLLPVISIFNASLALIYIAITVPLYEYIARYLRSQLWELR
ncbi:hypothetical protein GCM10007981_18490 [Thermocladium modestius]|uniref:Rod shape-determining protein MreD n=1 Tax=Thermocladium modestius TaxID=62609 RepID=A0A830GYG1_9CREN|nr:hypothetical protein [Thermocladium modestius]GGP22436.1 hypothetical protein GCM10007981_18490 [Thermocladium modestius]